MMFERSRYYRRHREAVQYLYARACIEVLFHSNAGLFDKRIRVMLRIYPYDSPRDGI